MMVTNEVEKTITALMEATGLDKETSESILVDFCQQALSLVADINKHLSEKNFVDASSLMHRLKGSAGNVRATDIAEQALLWEETLKKMEFEKLTGLLGKMEEGVQALITTLN